MSKKYAREDSFRVLAERSRLNEVTGCLEWQGGKHVKGYGILKLDGRDQKTHRIAYIKAHGAIPEGAHVLHRCDNAACVNPAHLFLGSNADNIADKVAKCRAGKALTKDAVTRIKQMLRSGATQLEIASLHGVHPCSISRIASGSRWAQVH